MGAYEPVVPSLSACSKTCSPILSLQLMRALMLTPQRRSPVNNDDLPDETTSLVLISRSEVLTDDVLPSGCSR